MSQPEFIATNLTTIVAEMIADYETRTGKKLQPGQVETLLLDAWAYRENLLRLQVQNASCMNLVAFAVAPVLDYLGQLVGVTRLGSVGAATTLRFYFITTHSSGTITAGKRVATNDGKMIFVTSEDAAFEASDPYVDVQAYCSTPGAAGNGYPVETITHLLDPAVNITSVKNTTTSAGGADQESDDQLRERIRLAPEAFSCAGSRQSYIYWAKTASQTIVDVVVASPDPGTVKIYPLVSGGIETPQEIIDAVLATCSGEKVRPLCDTVLVESPTAVEWEFDGEITVDPSYVPEEVIAAVESALEAFHTSKVVTLGKSVYRTQVIAAIMAVEGVVDIPTITLPAADVECDENEFPKLTDINVTAA